MTQTGIEISNLVISRGSHKVLNGLNLSIVQGSIFALLGGNGAGKSTALYAIMGLLKVQSGHILVNGFDPQKEPETVRKAIAYLPETVALYEHLTAWENIVYFLSLSNQTRTKNEIETALVQVRLDPTAWRKRLGNFSKGMRQKTAIALAVLRKTPILLLDEPTTGLDPKANQDFHLLLNNLKESGVAILMVTHDLLGACEVADCVGLITNGQLTQQWNASSSSPRFDLQSLHNAFMSPRVETLTK
jgi:ABC-2 type transport system ATP-binding protein